MTNTGVCRIDDNVDEAPESALRLPRNACLPINHCNLPAAVLGGLTFQRHPAPLLIDGVAELHRRLFQALERLTEPDERARQFMDYMTVYFRLAALEEVGLTPGRPKLRGRADYLRMVRGWAFDPDSREGAVLKGWVESRFGLLTRYHGGLLDDRTQDAYLHFQEARSHGLYSTNALEAQLDLLYAYCQYELHQAQPAMTHLSLYRGFNRFCDDQVLAKLDRHRWIVLLNNLSSFSGHRERAEEFGDHLLRVQVPLTKLFFYNRLLPGMLKGEEEYVVIGGIYEVERLA
ncbi:MAG: NAD(+)--dinitrogen-reductase ADP-D-ribosyltransferase [Pseudomonadota bacterium]|nr:NAD(+)--dinitrogen-reductase ADP-D-ribosyltransferase [Pseudomonadota bacterium]